MDGEKNLPISNHSSHAASLMEHSVMSQCGTSYVTHTCQRSLFVAFWCVWKDG